MNHKLPNENESGASNDKNDTEQECIVGISHLTVQNMNGAAALATKNPKQTADILKLDIDCFDELFDYLPLSDLFSIGNTCKQLHNIVGYILRQNFSALDVLCVAQNEIRFGKVFQEKCSIQFNQFIRRISLFLDDGLRYFQQIQSQCQRLKCIQLKYIELTRPKIHGLKEILNRVEDLQMINCKIDSGIHETVLAFCPNVRKFSVIGNANISNSQMDIFSQKYPALQHFEIELISEREVTELRNFLELNPNIRKLSISCIHFVRYTIDDLLLNTNIKLDECAIMARSFNSELCRMMQKLSKNGFCERLKLYLFLSELRQENVDQLASLNALVKFHLGRSSYMHSVKLAMLKSLEELFIFESDRIADLDTVALHLTNLQRIHFVYATFNDIFHFIGQSRQVKSIRVDNLGEGIHFSAASNVIDLMALNREREKLIRAQKVTVYVTEQIYLATKWNLKETDLTMIRIKRIESFNWDHDFGGVKEFI